MITALEPAGQGLHARAPQTPTPDFLEDKSLDAHAPKAVMMFAAGFGTRMQLWTKDQPNRWSPSAGRAADRTMR